MAVILQDPSHPNEILFALRTIADSQATRFRAAVAYTTLIGCNTLMPQFEEKMGEDNWHAIPKTIVTSLDFGTTEPAALEYLADVPACDLRVPSANVHGSNSVALHPAGSSFHPKVYIFDRDALRDVLIGSSNLTLRALTTNTEMATMEREVADAAALDQKWAEIVAASVPLTEELLDAYREARAEGHISIPDPPMAATTEPPEVIPFADPVLSGQIDPVAYEALWVEAGSMPSGGSHNQLELPRGGNRFFGFAFAGYEVHEVFPIGEPQVATEQGTWTASLRWHGDNGMERINLPTQYECGLSYPETAILFRRVGDQFQLRVAPWDSPVANAWRSASIAAGTYFALGVGSNRACGLF